MNTRDWIAQDIELLERTKPDHGMLPHLRTQLRGIDAAQGRSAQSLFVTGSLGAPSSEPQLETEEDGILVQDRRRFQALQRLQAQQGRTPG